MIQYKVLHCTAGNHDYDWPVKRGKRPANCEAHKPTKAKPKDLSIESIKGKIRSALDSASDRSMRCSCQINDNMTRSELNSLGAGCTGRPDGVPPGIQGGFVCPVLDSVRRTIGYAPFSDSI